MLAFLKHVIMTLKLDAGEKFIIERPKKFGGNLTFDNYEAVEEAFVKKELHPLDLKMALTKEISLLLEPFQKQKEKLEKVIKEGYS